MKLSLLLLWRNIDEEIPVWNTDEILKKVSCYKSFCCKHSNAELISVKDWAERVSVSAEVSFNYLSARQTAAAADRSVDALTRLDVDDAVSQGEAAQLVTDSQRHLPVSCSGGRC